MTTLSPENAQKASADLDSLLSQLLTLKNQILVLPDQSVASTFLNRNNVLASLVIDLKKGLPSTALSQINSAKSLFGLLKTDFDNYIRGNFRDFYV